MWESNFNLTCYLYLRQEKLKALPADKIIPFVYNKAIKYFDSALFQHVDSKSREESIKYRKQGNMAFIRYRSSEALKLYITSICYAPEGSEELALAYGNRSAATYKLGDPLASLVDINRALKITKNPDEKWVRKLQKRKQKCLAEIRGVSVNESLDEDALEINYETKYPLPEVHFKNEFLPNASEKIKLCFNEEFGRHLVAVDDIKTGEILGIKKPYAWVMPLSTPPTHCWHCTVRSVSLIPCRGCTLVMFCSENCKEAAFNQYHQIECQLLPFFSREFFGLVDEHLGLRIFLAATKQGIELKNLMNHPIYGNPFQKKYYDFHEKPTPEDYFYIHNLNDCFEFTKGDFEKFMHKTLRVAALLRLLKENSFFEKIEENARQKNLSNLTAVESFAGTLLLKYRLLSDINSHAFVECIKTSGDTDTQILGGVAGAVCTLFSFLNHSCDPNILLSSQRNSFIMRAFVPIKAGDQIFDNYGYGCHILESPRSERQSILKSRYFFNCQCPPCQFNWPWRKTIILEDFLMRRLKGEWAPKYKSSTCQANDLKIRKYSKKFWQIILNGTLAFKGKYDEKNFKFLCDYIDLLDKNVERSWEEFIFCEKLLLEMSFYRKDYEKEIVL